MSLTYDSLVQQIMDNLDRTDNATLLEVPNFIARAEQIGSRKILSIGMLQYVTGTLTPGINQYEKPANWRQNITFSCQSLDGLQTVSTLQLRSYEYMVQYSPQPGLQSIPIFYGDFDYNTIYIAPTPDLAYPFLWGYLQLPFPLSPQNQTNWYTNNAPDYIFYASMVEAMLYLKTDDRLQLFQGKMQEAIDSLNEQDKRRVIDRSANVGAA